MGLIDAAPTPSVPCPRGATISPPWLSGHGVALNQFLRAGRNQESHSGAKAFLLARCPILPLFYAAGEAAQAAQFLDVGTRGLTRGCPRIVR
jgi:hypothetical protein